MRIGIMTGSGFDPDPTINGLIEGARRIESMGFSSLWMATIYGHDGLTALAAIARETSTIELGTAVVASFPRHPMAMAQQALTVAEVSGDRFTLGLGLSHKYVIEEEMGLSYEKPVGHMRDYLSVMMPLLNGAAVNYQSQNYRVNTQLMFENTGNVPVLIAAMGPAMLKLAGKLSDGTTLWLVGPKTLEAHIVPTISEAAATAGRASPRIVAGVPIVLTKNITEAKKVIGDALGMYGSIPSYRAMLDREGMSGPEDVAILGDESELRDQLQALRDIGVTDFNAVVIDVEPGAYQRTLNFLAGLSL